MVNYMPSIAFLIHSFIFQEFKMIGLSLIGLRLQSRQALHLKPTKHKPF